MEEGILTNDDYSSIDPVNLHDNYSVSDRLHICMDCPLYVKDMEVCNPNLYLNPATNETSRKYKKGFVRGCGCLITAKVKHKTSHCHLGKW